MFKHIINTKPHSVHILVHICWRILCFWTSCHFSKVKFTVSNTSQVSITALNLWERKIYTYGCMYLPWKMKAFVIKQSVNSKAFDKSNTFTHNTTHESVDDSEEIENINKHPLVFSWNPKYCLICGPMILFEKNKVVNQITFSSKMYFVNVWIENLVFTWFDSWIFVWVRSKGRAVQIRVLASILKSIDSDGSLECCLFNKSGTFFDYDWLKRIQNESNWLSFLFCCFQRCSINL